MSVSKNSYSLIAARHREPEVARPCFMVKTSVTKPKTGFCVGSHIIDDELPNLLTGRQSPLVLAGVEYLFPLYKEANSYPHLLEEGIPGNPEELTPEELHAQAWPLVQPTFMKAREKAAAQYRQLVGTGQATADVKEAVLAAHHGQVELLFVAVGIQVWGNFDPSTNTIHVHQDPEPPGDDDLLDVAAIQSILNGGTVYAVEARTGARSCSPCSSVPLLRSGVMKWLEMSISNGIVTISPRHCGSSPSVKVLVDVQGDTQDLLQRPERDRHPVRLPPFPTGSDLAAWWGGDTLAQTAVVSTTHKIHNTRRIDTCTFRSTPIATSKATMR